MELKLLTYKVRKFATWCSNCTFMELKYVIEWFLADNTASSNCTFMELK